MTNISNLELTLMERRFRKAEREMALRKYRSMKSAQTGSPPTKPSEGSKWAQGLKQAQAARKAKDAEQPASHQSAAPALYAIYDDKEHGPMLFQIVNVSDTFVLARGVTGDGEGVKGNPLARLPFGPNLLIFESVEDSQAYADQHGLRLLGRAAGKNAADAMLAKVKEHLRKPQSA